MKFYTADDLTMRRVNIARWICTQVHKHESAYKYGELLPQAEINAFQFVVACLEAIECYIPITDVEDDGETNCLTEAKLTAIINNIETITGLTFHCMQTSYNPNNYEGVTGDFVPSAPEGNDTNPITPNIGSNPINNPIPTEVAYTGSWIPSFKTITQVNISTGITQYDWTEYINYKLELITIAGSVTDVGNSFAPLPKSTSIFTIDQVESSYTMIRVEIKESGGVQMNDVRLANSQLLIDWLPWEEGKTDGITSKGTTITQDILNVLFYSEQIGTTVSPKIYSKKADDEQVSSIYDRVGVYLYVEIDMVIPDIKLHQKYYIAIGDVPASIRAKNVFSTQDVLNKKLPGTGSNTLGDNHKELYQVNDGKTAHSSDGTIWIKQADTELVEDLIEIRNDYIS